MKKSMILILILFVSVNFGTLAKQFELIPNWVDFEDAVSNSSTIMAYGFSGVVFLSTEEGKNWIQKQAFEKESIVQILTKDENFIAFDYGGKISISKDNGLTWKQNESLDDTILAVVETKNGYFFRGRNKIFTTDEKFKTINEYKFSSNFSDNYTYYDWRNNFRKSILVYKDFLIVEIDSARLLRFDNKLNMLDTFYYSKLGIYDSTHSFKEPGYILDKDSNNLFIYFKGSKKEGKSVLIDYFIGSTSDFKKIEYKFNSKSRYLIYQIQDNKLYSCDKTSKLWVDTTKLSESSFYNSINNFTVFKNSFYIVGNGKLLLKYNMTDSVLTVISNGTQVQQMLTPVQIGDSSFLAFSYKPYIYRSDDNINTYKLTIDKTNSNYNNYFGGTTIESKIFKDNKIIITGKNSAISAQALLLISEDYGKSFEIKEMEFQYQLSSSIILLLNSYYQSDLCSYNNYIVENGGVFKNSGKYIQNLYTSDYNGKIISRLTLYDKYARFIHSSDTNNFILHYANFSDSTSEIASTTDKGTNWNIIRKYSKNDYFHEIKEKNIFGRNYIIILGFNKKDTINFIEAVDIETKEHFFFKKWCNVNHIKDFGWHGIGFECDDSLCYISFGDSLYYTKNLFESKKWKYWAMPNGGQIITPLKKIGDKFYLRYSDNDIQFAAAAFWLKPLEPMNVEDEKLIGNYLYAYPPYPLPAKDYVSSEIYWDTKLDINSADMSVYNLFGDKICGKEKISLQQKTIWSGTVTWDASSAPPGLYLLRIKHGTKTETIKMLIE